MKKIARVLVYVAGLISKEVLLQNQLLSAQIKIFKAQQKGRLKLSDEDKRTLAQLGKQLGRRLLAKVECIVTPDTIFRWYRELVARKYDGSKKRNGPGRPPTEADVEKLVIDIARENRTWGYRRIMGALANLGHHISHQTVANILDRHDLKPAPVRGKGTSWAEFIRSHMNVLAAVDFFTVEVLSLRGLVTYHVLFFIHLETRKINIAGITHSPDDAYMRQIARNVTFADTGFLEGKRYLIHDRDTKFTAAFRETLKGSGVKCLALPPQSPNLNAFAERFARSIRQECLDKLILLNANMIWHATSEFADHYHAERNHQGVGNTLIAPLAEDRVGEPQGPIRTRERLGGLLRFYHRVA